MRLRRFLFIVFLAVGLVIVLGHFWPRSPDVVQYRSLIMGDRTVRFMIVDLTEMRLRFELQNDPAHPKTVEAWRDELGADIVWNAAYFTEANTPAGFFKTKGGVSAIPWPSVEEQSDAHNYTFMLTVHADDFALDYLPLHPAREPEDSALLSFPTLVAGGESIVTKDSHLRAARTVVAEDASGRDYLVVTEKGSLSLYELAEWLSDQPEQFVIAGNLDGGPSTGLSIENGTDDIERQSAAVPSVIAGFRAKKY